MTPASSLSAVAALDATVPGGAPVLAFVATVAAVASAWELAAAAERARVLRTVGRMLAPVARAGRHGREPSPPERRRIAVVGTLGLIAAGAALGGPWLGAMLGFGGPSLSAAAVRARRRRYAARLEADAAEAARALADAVSAGHAVRGAVIAAAPGVGGASGHELRRAAADLELGEPTEAALERLRGRASCRTWDTLCAALLLQRDAGGDLAGLLRRLAASLEAAARADADARAATAQARFSAYAVTALPFAGLLLAELGSPGFAMGLLGDPLSAALAAAALALQATALVVVRTLARKDQA